MNNRPQDKLLAVANEWRGIAASLSAKLDIIQKIHGLGPSLRTHLEQFPEPVRHNLTAAIRETAERISVRVMHVAVEDIDQTAERITELAATLELEGTGDLAVTSADPKEATRDFLKLSRDLDRRYQNYLSILEAIENTFPKT